MAVLTSAVRWTSRGTCRGHGREASCTSSTTPATRPPIRACGRPRSLPSIASRAGLSVPLASGPPRTARRCAWRVVSSRAATRRADQPERRPRSSPRAAAWRRSATASWRSPSPCSSWTSRCPRTPMAHGLVAAVADLSGLSRLVPLHRGRLGQSSRAVHAHRRRGHAGCSWRNLLLLLMASVLPFPTSALASAMDHGTHADQFAAVVLYAGVQMGMATTWLLVFSYLMTAALSDRPRHVAGVLRGGARPFLHRDRAPAGGCRHRDRRPARCARDVRGTADLLRRDGPRDAAPRRWIAFLRGRVHPVVRLLRRLAARRRAGLSGRPRAA